METIRELLSNYILNVAILSWFAAQVLKTIFTFVSTKKLNLERMFGAGGMPSAHSALVCSMAVAVSRIAGVGSPLFALASMLAAIVMYDAMGVRRAAGEQAKVINKIVFNWNKAVNDDAEDEEPDGEIEHKTLKEFLGHTPLEVLCGALLGILIAMLVPAA